MAVSNKPGVAGLFNILVALTQEVLWLRFIVIFFGVVSGDVFLAMTFTKRIIGLLFNQVVIGLL